MKKNIIEKGRHLVKSKIDTIRLMKASGKEKIIHQIIKEIEKNDWTEEEVESLKKLSDLRGFYSENSSDVFIKDFGFGKSDDNRTEEEMLHGVGKVDKISNIYHKASSSVKQTEFMFKIIRGFNLKKCFELGTCLGISTAYGAEALRLNGSNNPFLSFEGAPELAKLATSSLRKFNIENFKVVEGRFLDTLSSYVSDNDNIDFAYIDGHHEEKATLNYFELLYPSLSGEAIIVFDDIRWSNGMYKAWQTLKNDNRIAWTVDIYFRGICCITKENKKENKRNYKLWL